jgi:glycosyltransferase Alg8
VGFALYILLLAALALHAPAGVFDPGTRQFVVVLGVIGAWRYSWQLVHLVRSLLYRRVVFPRWRRVADRWLAAGHRESGHDGFAAETGSPLPEDPRDVHVVVATYRIAAETTAAVYRALIAEAAACGRPVTLVASIVEMADARFIKTLFCKLAPPSSVRLVLVRQRGRGKRAAIGTALRAISRQRAHPAGTVVLLDGDTVMAPGTLRRCLPFFDLMPTVGGLTTDEDAVVAGSRLMHLWHRLRFAQRHLIMSSLGLSKRLFAMTGRMSMFRTGIATNPSFIARIETDGMSHWRLGRLRFLTGEDKSTWMWLLERGYDMLYVPDVRVVTIEHPPSPYFVPATTSLMLRWFGNMLRASGTAILLGPRRVGAFFWWCLVDQRLSMWTPLIGPVVAGLVAATVTPAFLYAYLLWIMATRLVQALLLLSVRDWVSPLYPLLIYYNQVYGALLKTWVLFRLDRQRWTRQNIRSHGWEGPGLWLRRLSSVYLHALSLLALVAGVAFLTGVLPIPWQASPI